MARDIKAGVILTADTKQAQGALGEVSKVVNRIGGAASSTAKELKKLEDRTIETVRTFAEITTGVRAGMEILKKFRDVAVNAIVPFIEASLESRAETDANKQSIQEMVDAAEDLQIQIGDRLVPTLAAMADAIRPVIDAASDWVEANEDLIDQQIDQFVIGAARAFEVVAKTTIRLAQVVLGLQGAYESVKAGINAFIATVVRGFQRIIEVAALAGELFSTELQSDILVARDALKDVADTFADTANDSVKEIEKTGASILALEKTIDKIEPATRRFSDAFTLAQAEARSATKETTKVVEDESKKQERAAVEAARRAAAAKREAEQKAREAAKEAASLQAERDKSLDDFGARVAAQSQFVIDEQQRVLDAELDRLAREIEIAEKIEAAWQGAAENIGSSFGTMFAGIITGQESIEESLQSFVKSFLNSVIDAASTALQASAIQAGGAAGANAFTFGGPAAPVLAPIAIAAATSLIKGLISQLPSAQTGGVVTGGIQGRDSVLSMLAPGEIILPADIAHAFRSIRDGGTLGRGPSLVIENINISNLVPDDRAGYERLVEETILPVFSRAEARGRI